MAQLASVVKDTPLLELHEEMDIAVIASIAAMELDNALLGRPSDLKAVRLLAKRLLDAVTIAPAGPDHRRALDTRAVAMMGRALASEAKTVREVVEEAEKISQRLSKLSAATSAREIQEARTFCVALADVASMQKRAQRRYSRSNFGK